MSPIPNRPNSKKKPRKHVPALMPDTLKASLDRLKALGLSADTTRTLTDILNTASNHDHSKADVIVKSLPKDRQKLIGKTAKAVKGISDDIMARGKKRLMDMSEDEWNTLVDEQTN